MPGSLERSGVLAVDELRPRVPEPLPDRWRLASLDPVAVPAVNELVADAHRLVPEAKTDASIGEVDEVIASSRPSLSSSSRTDRTARLCASVVRS